MVRGKRVDLTVVKLPMVPNRYYRGEVSYRFVALFGALVFEPS
jgi:hypothetical protein